MSENVLTGCLERAPMLALGASLPSAGGFLGADAALWEHYRWPIIAIASLCVIQFLLIVALLLQRASRRRSEIALRESEARFRLMTDTAPVMVWMSGPDKLCTYFNKRWLDFTGRPMEGELGDGWSEGVHADDLGRCLETYVQAFGARREFRMEYRLRRSDGEYRWILDTGVPRFDYDGNFEGYIGSCIDITEEQRAEEALRDSQLELRVLTGRLLLAQENERRRIARELHDDLNQSLALLSVEMDALSQQPPESADQLGPRMQELSTRVKHLSSDVHHLSHRLHPAKLEQLGLAAAVRGLCNELAQGHDLSVEFTSHDVPEAIPEDVALCLYRIAQEGLTNIVKHSGARRARVKLNGTIEGISLRIIDDGAGFDPRLADGQGGLGLVSMRERLRLVNGQMVIDSRPSGGSRVDVRVPGHSNPQAEMVVSLSGCGEGV